MGSPARSVAVTGASGYVAGRLIERLERDDNIERIVAVDILPLERRHSPKLVFHRVDVTAPMGDILAENRVDALVHLAFVLSPRHDRDAVREVNLGGTASVLESCARAGVRHILYLSSTTVYGAHPDNPDWLSEESPVRPVKGFQYGEDKAQTEREVEEFARENSARTATILRACPVLGPAADNFISRSLSRPIFIGVRGYDPPMQLLHEDDLCDVMVRCLRRPVPGTFNVAGDGAIAWSEMARTSGRKLMSLPAPVIYGLAGVTWKLRLQGNSASPGLDLVRYRWTVSTDKIKREMGVAPHHSSRDAWLSFAQRPRKLAPANEARR